MTVTPTEEKISRSFKRDFPEFVAQIEGLGLRVQTQFQSGCPIPRAGTIADMNGTNGLLPIYRVRGRAL